MATNTNVFVFLHITKCILVVRGTRWRSWLRHCPKSRKIAGSIPDGVTGNFHWHYPSGRTMALGSTQPLTEMSTRNTSWGVKAASVYGWQPYHVHVPIVLKSESLNLLVPWGPVQACYGIALPFTLVVLRRWRYRPGWALASFTIRLQASQSLALSLHSFIPIFLRSVDTSSSHLIFGLRLVAYSFPYIFFLELWCLAFFLYDQAIVFFGI